MGLVWAAFAAQVPVLKAQIDASDGVFGAVFLFASVGAIASMWVAPGFDRLFGPGRWPPLPVCWERSTSPPGPRRA
jgi:hypothetical protein